MKKLIFLFLFGVTYGISSTAQTQTPSTYTSSTDAEIRIKETTVNTPVLRGAPAPAMNAWLSDTQIDLTFLRYLGTVTITVANVQGTVYTAAVTADTGVEWVINTQGWIAGDYAITIVRSNGQTFAGDFEL